MIASKLVIAQIMLMGTLLKLRSKVSRETLHFLQMNENISSVKLMFDPQCAE